MSCTSLVRAVLKITLIIEINIEIIRDTEDGVVAAVSKQG